MSLLDKIEPVRRTMVLFFIVGTPESMEGSKIGAVNTAIREIIPEIRDISNENADALIKIAVLEFSSAACWITENGPVEASKFNWTYLDAGGMALNEKLFTKAFMQEATGSYVPVLFLFSGRCPIDEWHEGLELLKNS